MKKLMTMIAAVATAFGLYAADDACKSYTDFNSGSGFSVGPFVNAKDADTTATWSGLLEEGDQNQIVEINHPMDDIPAVFGEIGAGFSLQVATTLGNPIYRVNSQDSLEGDAYVDFQTSMTVFDTAPESAYTDAKVAVWLQEVLDNDENVTGTNLWIRAGFYGEKGVEPKDYNCGPVANLKDWNRVTIKAIADITEKGEKPGFVVFINGKVIGVSAEDGFTYDIGNCPTLTPAANDWYTKRALFPSLKSSAGVTALGFDGKGYVDNIAFTPTPPRFAADKEFFYIEPGANVTSFTVGTDPYTAKTPFPVDGATLSVGINYENGFFGDSPTNITGEVNRTYTVGNAKKLGATLTIGGKDLPFATVGEAMNELNMKTYEAGTQAKLALGDDAGAIMLDNANINLTLDLAGRDIKGADTAGSAAITVMAGELLITNSTDAVGQVIAGNAQSTLAVDEGSGKVSITAGKYNGEVFLTPGAITGGWFTEDPTAMLADGYIAPKDATDNYYKVKKGAYVAQIVRDDTTYKKYETLADAVAAAQSGDTIALLKEYSFDSNTETVLFPNGVTFDLAGQTLTVAAAKQKFGTAENAEVTLTDSATTKGKLVINSTDYGFSVMGGSVLYVGACCIEEIGAMHPVFDIYGATVNCGADADIKGASDIFRFKDANLTSTVNVTGGKYESQDSAQERCVFHLYKAGHTANINITGGAFTFNNYLIDAYSEVKDGETAGTKVTNAPPVLVFAELGAGNAARFSKQVLVSPMGTSIIKEKDVLAADCKVVADTEKPGFFKVAAIDYATLTVTKGDANVTAVVVSNATEEVTLDGDGKAKFDKDDAVVITVYPTFAEGYELDTEKSSKLTATMTADATITVYSKSAGQVYPPDWKGGDDPYIQGKFADWIAGKGKGADLTDTLAKDAFLLDCAISEVEAAKLNFKITKIEKGDDGKWLVKVETAGDGDQYLNGYVNIISAADGVKLVDEAGVKQFFKAVLDTVVLDK